MFSFADKNMDGKLSFSEFEVSLSLTLITLLVTCHVRWWWGPRPLLRRWSRTSPTLGWCRSCSVPRQTPSRRTCPTSPRPSSQPPRGHSHPGALLPASNLLALPTLPLLKLDPSHLRRPTLQIYEQLNIMKMHVMNFYMDVDHDKVIKFVTCSC